MENQKRIIKFILILILGLSYSLTILAGTSTNNHGLQFSAYSVSPDSRTSFEAPYNKTGIRFKDYFSVSFDMCVLMTQEKFGYIARIIIDDTTSIDVYLRNKKGIPCVCLITKDGEIGVLLQENSSLKDWNKVSVVLKKEKETFSIYGNDTLYGTIGLEGRAHYAKVCLGAIRLDGFSSTDCAPIVVKEVEISNRIQRTYCKWSLYSHNNASIIDDDTGKEQAIVTNPVWTIDEHDTWKEIFSHTFNNKVFPVIDTKKERCFFISDNETIEFDFRTSEERLRHSRYGVTPDKLTNNFIVSGEQIIYYDFENDGQFVSYDINTGQWASPVSRKVHSRFLHHNKFISPTDSSIIQIFGYGFHLYNNEIHQYNKAHGIKCSVLDPISPRYMSSISVRAEEGKVYILGGIGNTTGIQEYGVEQFSDLWEMDLNTFKCRCLCPQICTDKEIATPTFYISDDKNTVTGLFFFPQKSNTALHIREINLQTSESRIISKDIQYYFLDKDSFADMLINKDKCYVIVTNREDETFKARIYSISLPILLIDNKPETDKNRSGIYMLLCILAIAAGTVAVFVYSGQRHKKGDSRIAVPTIVAPLKKEDYTNPGIYLLNGFCIIDRNGNDITKNFTPTMRLLLSLIILHTQKYGGISNAELKETLWSDKSDSSYFNNRSVLLHKIRTELEAVCEQCCVIRSNDNKWSIEFKDITICDYTNAMEFLNSIDEQNIDKKQFERLVAIAEAGNLLAFITFEAFDKFKAEYSDKMIGILSTLRDSERFKDDDHIIETLCECILLIDSLDEDSIRIISKIFLKHKMITKAKNRFESFRKEYCRIMGEDYEKTFNEFIRTK